MPIDPAALRQFTIFAGCSDAELAALAPAFGVRQVRRGETVYTEGDPAAAVYFARSGTSEMGKHDPVEERAFFLGPLGPGDVFGFGEAFFPRHYITVTATSAGELLVLPSADFHASLLAIPSANRYVLQALAWLARIHVFLLDWEGGEKRLRYWLYYRAWTDGETDGDRVLLPPATHEEIARVLNLSREFVSRTLSRLKERGVLRGTAGRIEVARDWFEERLDDPAYDPSLHRFFNIG